jgi:hypothetical protein
MKLKRKCPPILYQSTFCRKPSLPTLVFPHMVELVFNDDFYDISIVYTVVKVTGVIENARTAQSITCKPNLKGRCLLNH